jgi:hypothetical protein
VLSWEHERVVQRDWTVSCANRWYQLERQHESLNLAGRKIIVRTLRSGAVELVFRGSKLRHRRLPARPQRQSPLPAPVKTVRIPKPNAEHPWRRFDSGIGQGQEFWRKQKQDGRTARRQLVLGNSGRPPLRSGLPPLPRTNCKPTQLTK